MDVGGADPPRWRVALRRWSLVLGAVTGGAVAVVALSIVLARPAAAAPAPGSDPGGSLVTPAGPAVEPAAPAPVPVTDPGTAPTTAPGGTGPVVTTLRSLTGSVATGDELGLPGEAVGRAVGESVVAVRGSATSAVRDLPRLAGSLGSAALVPSGAGGAGSAGVPTAAPGPSPGTAPVTTARGRPLVARPVGGTSAVPGSGGPVRPVGPWHRHPRSPRRIRSPRSPSCPVSPPAGTSATSSETSSAEHGNGSPGLLLPTAPLLPGPGTGETVLGPDPSTRLVALPRFVPPG